MKVFAEPNTFRTESVIRDEVRRAYFNKTTVRVIYMYSNDFMNCWHVSLYFDHYDTNSTPYCKYETTRLGLKWGH